MPDDVRLAVRGKAFSLNQTDHAQGHILPAVETWLRLGISGLRRKVEAYRATSESPVHYVAALFALQAGQEFILRYADLALRRARQSPNPTRAAELDRISGVCRWLSKDPPRDFHKAVQAVWLVDLVLHTTVGARDFSPGRIDQYLYPYYRAAILDAARASGLQRGVAVVAQRHRRGDGR